MASEANSWLDRIHTRLCCFWDKANHFLVWLCSSLTSMICLQAEGSYTPAYARHFHGEVPQWLHSSGRSSVELSHLFNLISVDLQKEQHSCLKILFLLFCFSQFPAKQGSSLLWVDVGINWMEQQPQGTGLDLLTICCHCQRKPMWAQDKLWDADLWSPMQPLCFFYMPLSNSQANSMLLMMLHRESGKGKNGDLHLELSIY